MSLSAPFPYFGGKARAAPLVWDLLGQDNLTYCEPYGGSYAVGLAAPVRPLRMVVNDLDGMLPNFWRSVLYSPLELSAACDWPTSHLDLIARREYLRQIKPDFTESLRSSPFFHDPQVAGWWAWGVSNSIDLMSLADPTEEQADAYWERLESLHGRNGSQPFTYGHWSPARGVQADRQSTGAIQQPGGPAGRNGSRPRLGAVHGKPAQQGVTAGRKVAVPTFAKPGSERGVQAGRTENREPSGRSGRRPHTWNQGGVNAQRRADLPNVRSGGPDRGVGAGRQTSTPRLNKYANGVNAKRADLIDPSAEPLSGARLAGWFDELHCYAAGIATETWTWYILCVDALTILRSRSILGLQPSNGPSTTCALFIDPPYPMGQRTHDSLYSTDSTGLIPDLVRRLTEPFHPKDPRPLWTHPQARIVLAGYEGDYPLDLLPDARVIPWERQGGMESQKGPGKQGNRQEVLIANPTCLTLEPKPTQGALI